MLSDQANLQWISFYQLYIHYQLSFKDAGVILHDGKWFIISDQKPCFSEDWGFKKLAKGFRLMIQQLLKDCNISASTATVRPESRWISCHVGSISLPVRLVEFSGVEAWLQKTLGCPATGQGKSLAKLPPVT